MLTYSIRIGDNDLKRDKLVWSEKFVAPDLSFVSGVTSQHYHIDADEYISASIGINSNFTRLKVACQNVTRNGYIIIKKKEYPIKRRKKSVVSGGTLEYVDIGGVYYYITGSTLTVKNWLQEQWYQVGSENKVRVIEGNFVIENADIDRTNDVVKLDTIIWIEDETVTIDGNTYLFDPYDGGIKYYETGRSLTPDEVTKCENIVYKHYDNTSDYEYVTKFVLRKTEDESYDYDRLGYCTYFYYAFYKETYYPVVKSGNGYICENLPATDNTVKFRGDNVTPPARISQLKNYDAYVIIDGIEVDIQHMVQNANGGDEIAIYLSDDTHNLDIGDKLMFSYTDGLTNTFPVYSISGNEFVMYENVKYMVESGITDTVSINGVEYDITYPDGKKKGKDALVSTDDELIPMEILSGETQLRRYGYIVSGDPTTSAVTEAVYDIVTYDGVRINDNVYRVFRSEDNKESYVTIDKPVTMEFNIVSVEGSSLIICEPSLNVLEYDDDFINSMSPIFCDIFVQRTEHIDIYSKNRAFGTRIITPEIGFAKNNKADSSSTYDNILDELSLFTNDGYIQIKLPLEMNVANNAMQEDVVTRDFYEAEKKKAINSIVDMEKDVYVPMYMENGKKYSGSSTVFYPVTDIDINLHFRTRNLTNWKINDKDTNVEASGDNDNWFCTDFFPYKQILESVNDGGKTVMNSSDLMSLLFFDNDDIFYQRDSVGKSFLRFSYYDSPDPNTQSLLCTSTVFMDEHALYKKYLDNSRRNVKDYGVIQEQKFQTGETSDGTEYIIPGEIIDSSGDVINRISVATEVLTGPHDPKRKEYNVSDIDMTEMLKDTRRISSRFSITNKYNTDTSSEGFYLYMFREYSENLRPKPIYMKIEFNHAGIGKTIPFIVPMHWSGGTETDNEYVPERKLTLKDDLEELKEGYPLSYVYAQTYIPLYAVYDYNHKQYAYVFDDRYIDRETLDKENKIRLNLFEIKIKNESTVTAEARAQVRNNNVERANINVNENQFKDNI